jgi:hypothetical protein
MAERKQDWAEAKKLCRLNQNDIEMAKRLGFHPRSLIRLRPDPKQKWKLPVKYWIHELHFKKFGHVIGEKPAGKPQPIEIAYGEDAQRRFERELYWEDYWDRNSDTGAAGSSSQAGTGDGPGGADWSISDDDVPF